MWRSNLNTVNLLKCFLVNWGGGERRGGISKNFARSKAQRKKTKPKSRCQGHAGGEREGQGQNCSSLHGKSLLFKDVWSFSELAATGRQTDESDSRKVSDEKRYHRYLRHYAHASFGSMLQEQGQSCSLGLSKDRGRNRIIPGLRWHSASRSHQD